MTVVIEIMDDSGYVEATLEIPLLEYNDFVEQLPVGWEVEPVTGLEEE